MNSNRDPTTGNPKHGVCLPEPQYCFCIPTIFLGIPILGPESIPSLKYRYALYCHSWQAQVFAANDEARDVLRSP